MKKVKPEQATPRKDGHRRALKVGPHGKQKNADGSLHSTPNPHDGKKHLAEIG